MSAPDRNVDAILFAFVCIAMGFGLGWSIGVRDAEAVHARTHEAAVHAATAARYDSLLSAMEAEADSLLRAMPPGVYVYQVEDDG